MASCHVAVRARPQASFDLSSSFALLPNFQPYKVKRQGQGDHASVGLVDACWRLVELAPESARLWHVGSALKRQAVRHHDARCLCSSNSRK